MKQHSRISFIIFILVMFHHTDVFSADNRQVSDTLPKSEENEEHIFTNVEIQASPDMKKWRDHLIKKMPTAIEKATLRKIPAGKYEVELRLLIEKNGDISKIEIEKDPGYGLAEASIEIIRSGPKWKAGESCGRRLRSYKKQPFIYVIKE
jgi:protein TonB